MDVFEMFDQTTVSVTGLLKLNGLTTAMFANVLADRRANVY